MGLQLRRGTESDRLLITPASGEPLYTTDTRKFYIGDGVTPGGILLADAGAIDSTGQSIYATITYVDNAIDSVIGSAPNSLNTLQELAQAINNDSDFYNSLRGLIDGQLDSGEVINLIDSAYINARLDTTSFLDSAEALILIDSAVVESRIKESFIATIVDSAYVNNRLDTTSFLDSVEAINLIDSAYVNARLDTTLFLDSAEVINLIDSDYVNARVNTRNFLDSAEALILIDSAHVLSKSQNYIDTQIKNLIDAAPEALDTLNELAAAINDDSNFAGTITASIATKVAKTEFSTYFDSNLALKTTDDLAEGDSNLYYTRDRFDSAFNNRITNVDRSIVPDSSYQYDIGSPVKPFKDIWADDVYLSRNSLYLGFTKLSVDENGALNISTVDSNYASLDSSNQGILDPRNLDNAFDVVLDSTGQQTVDSFKINEHRTARYVIQMTHNSIYHSTEILLMHNDTDVFMTEYAVLKTQDSDVAYITADINNDNVRLLITPSYSNTTIKAKRLIIDV